MEIVAGLLIFIGLAGSILPFLPGPPLSFAGLFIYAYIKGFAEVGALPLIIFGVLTVLTIVFDIFAPVIASQKYRSSKYGTIGIIAGSILGINFGGPFGILLGSLAGGFLGEYLVTKNIETSLKITKGVFIGFLLGSLFRISVSLTIAIYYVYLLLT